MKFRLLNTLAVLMAAVGFAHAQSASPFTVLSNNSDIKNLKLYVEIAYTKPECGDYQAKFRLAKRGNPTGNAIGVDSFLNNPGTYETNVAREYLNRPQAGGYKLRFNLPPNATVNDSFRICVETYRLPYRCVGCGAAGSDAIFRTEDINPACPYKGSDLLACRQRGNSTRLWEGWVRDARDCKVYRIVQMPDGKWWFAQNLNFQKDLVYNSAASNNPTDGLGQYWCTAPGGVDVSTWGNTSCATYGALYTWKTAMAQNGRNYTGNVKQTPITEESTAQGICPDGWVVPGFKDWGMMFNAVEGTNCDITNTANVLPCNHLYNTSQASGANAGKWLRSTKQCQQLKTDGTSNNAVSCADATNPAWTLAVGDVKIPYSAYLGTDKFGFNVLPAMWRYPSANFYGVAGIEAYFWTSSSQDASFTSIYGRQLKYNTNNATQSWWNPNHAFSVRCVAAQNSIDPDCPYHNSDLVACRQRTAGNYEAWIRDSRDAKVYRIVSMPDRRWWFAQELFYTQGQTPVANTTANYGNGYYWYTNQSEQATATFGAQYTWYAMMTDDNVQGGTVNPSVPFGQKSTVRGVCPQGWFVPSTYDWGLMLNYVDGCPAGAQGTGNCLHNPSASDGNWRGGSYTGTAPNLIPPAAVKLKVANPRGLISNIYPSWTANASGADGVDSYGFSLYPTGYRSASTAASSNFGLYDIRHTATEAAAGSSIYRHIGYYANNASYVGGAWDKYSAGPVRCIGPNVQ